MKSNTNAGPEIRESLGIDQSSGHGNRFRRWLLVALLAIVGVTITVVWKMSDESNSMDYQTQKAQQGNLTVSVTATGALEPTNQVDVGTEVSGTVETVEVDYNDRVKVGQVLARLDTSRLQAQVLQSRAALEAAGARVLETQATVNEIRNELARFQQVRELSNNKVPSQHDMDAAQAALQRAEANEANAKAKVSEARATLEANETDLSKAVIRSPINGIVLTRSVEPGQTVAASLQAPVLFTLAEDLAQMELHVDVDEADVGLVKDGQEAIFTVDAYPDLVFPARITQVRFGSQTVDGVVTYETVLNVDNSDLFLRPGMTATADITVKKIENAVLVPNPALRFTPPVREEKDPSDDVNLVGKLLPRRPRGWSKKHENTNAADKQQRVWVLRDKQLVAIDVKTGATDGTMTEITDGDVEPEMALVVDAVRERP
ncbi:MAG: efflux RND transporter periplasmic adaptor subunit [Deltaproteobacteria bacterium]|nr:efflux RND transporter periplasmic adaptor subunit [Deltaproteobacteria bacterium]MBW2259150.1 efflux RND transporter periplasmic adaptor subunit [Deltaproteobacteria bacterium]